MHYTCLSFKKNKKEIPYNPVNTPPPVYKSPRIYAPQICNPINIPNISPPPRIHALPNIGPLNLSSLRNIKFPKNVSLPQVFSCILLVQFIYLVSP